MGFGTVAELSAMLADGGKLLSFLRDNLFLFHLEGMKLTMMNFFQFYFAQTREVECATKGR